MVIYVDGVWCELCVGRRSCVVVGGVFVLWWVWSLDEWGFLVFWFFVDLVVLGGCLVGGLSR